MDPDVVLALLRELVALADPESDSQYGTAAYVTLADAVRDLDEWLTRGGHPPTAWMTEIQEV